MKRRRPTAGRGAGPETLEDFTIEAPDGPAGVVVGEARRRMQAEEDQEMADSAEDLAARQAGVRARLVQAIRETLWQAHGQPTEGMELLQRHAELAADAAIGIIIDEADLFASGGERLAAALTANERCRDEILRLRGGRG